MLFLFSPQLILQKSNGLFQKKTIIFQGSRRGPKFYSGFKFFPIETNTICDFQGGESCFTEFIKQVGEKR